MDLVDKMLDDKVQKQIVIEELEKAYKFNLEEFVNQLVGHENNSADFAYFIYQHISEFMILSYKHNGDLTKFNISPEHILSIKEILDDCRQETKNILLEVKTIAWKELLQQLKGTNAEIEKFVALNIHEFKAFQDQMGKNFDDFVSEIVDGSIAILIDNILQGQYGDCMTDDESDYESDYGDYRPANNELYAKILDVKTDDELMEIVSIHKAYFVNLTQTQSAEVRSILGIGKVAQIVGILASTNQEHTFAAKRAKTEEVLDLDALINKIFELTGDNKEFAKFVQDHKSSFGQLMRSDLAVDVLDPEKIGIVKEILRDPSVTQLLQEFNWYYASLLSSGDPDAVSIAQKNLHGKLGDFCKILVDPSKQKQLLEVVEGGFVNRIVAYLDRILIAGHQMQKCSIDKLMYKYDKIDEQQSCRDLSKGINMRIESLYNDALEIREKLGKLRQDVDNSLDQEGSKREKEYLEVLQKGCLKDLAQLTEELSAWDQRLRLIENVKADFGDNIGLTYSLFTKVGAIFDNATKRAAHTDIVSDEERCKHKVPHKKIPVVVDEVPPKISSEVDNGILRYAFADDALSHGLNQNAEVNSTDDAMN